MRPVDDRLLDHYPRFERGVAKVLLAGMAVVIALAVINFVVTTLATVPRLIEQLDYRIFQTLFDRILAALIALELAHSVHQMASGKHGLRQVKTVIVIGVLAVVRKLVILEVHTTSGAFLAGLAAAILALGLLFALVHWIERERGDDAGTPSPGASD